MIPRPVGRRRAKLTPDGEDDVGVSPREIDAAFYGRILGVQSVLDIELNKFEKRVLRDLERLLVADISHSDMVPRLPAVVPRVMRALRDEDSSSADLAAEIGRDAVLVSEVIRLSNSPYFRVGKEITSLERAVFRLGRTGVRQLVTNAAFKPLINVNKGYFSRLSGTLLWEHSEKTALACDCMAGQQRVDRFQAYLAGIVQNVGMTVSLQLLDRHFTGSEVPRAQRFHEQLRSHARTLSAKIARQWSFPEPVVEALERQADDSDIASMSPAAAILFVGDKLAKLHLMSREGRFKNDGQPDMRLPEHSLSACYRACYQRLSA